MKVAQHVAELLGPVHHQIHRLRSARVQKVLQASSLDVVHYDDEAVICIYNIYDARQVGVMKFLEHLGLRDQSLAHHLLIVSAVLAHFLNGPRLVGALIQCQVHHAHSAVSDFIQNFIFSVQYGAYLQHRSVFLSKLMSLNENGADVVILISLYIQLDHVGDPVLHDIRRPHEVRPECLIKLLRQYDVPESVAA